MVLLQANLKDGAEAPCGVDSEMTALSMEFYMSGKWLVDTQSSSAKAEGCLGGAYNDG